MFFYRTSSFINKRFERFEGTNICKYNYKTRYSKFISWFFKLNSYWFFRWRYSVEKYDLVLFGIKTKIFFLNKSTLLLSIFVFLFGITILFSLNFYYGFLLSLLGLFGINTSKSERQYLRIENILK